MNDHSDLLSKSLDIIYPFLIVFGGYIIINGHISPGGGFQGGAILASVYISKYLVMPIYDYQLDIFKKMEKLLLVIIILMPFSFIFFGAMNKFPDWNILYLMLMNISIGIKVACGITIIFLRFVFFETRSL
ncbi:MAG: MnhB domain-containing protein [Clostridia bacterium]|nr:MnhB domain-containing protein [Clostridia bacterium]